MYMVVMCLVYHITAVLCVACAKFCKSHPTNCVTLNVADTLQDWLFLLMYLAKSRGDYMVCFFLPSLFVLVFLCYVFWGTIGGSRYTEVYTV